jgi:poly(A) polymerase
VTQEISKLLAAPDPTPSLSAMQSCGVLDLVLPGAVAVALEPLIAREKEFSVAPSWRRRLAALGGAAHLRLSGHDADYIAAIRKPAADLAMDLYRDGRDIVLDRCLLVGRADDIGRALSYRHAPMPLRGDDLLAAGLAPGPGLGAALRAAEEAWVHGGFTAARTELLTRALKAMKNKTAPEG